MINKSIIKRLYNQLDTWKSLNNLINRKSGMHISTIGIFLKSNAHKINTLLKNRKLGQPAKLDENDLATTISYTVQASILC